MQRYNDNRNLGHNIDSESRGDTPANTRGTDCFGMYNNHGQRFQAGNNVFVLVQCSRIHNPLQPESGYATSLNYDVGIVRNNGSHLFGDLQEDAVAIRGNMIVLREHRLNNGVNERLINIEKMVNNRPDDRVDDYAYDS